VVLTARQCGIDGRSHPRVLSKSSESPSGIPVRNPRIPVPGSFTNPRPTNPRPRVVHKLAIALTLHRSIGKSKKTLGQESWVRKAGLGFYATLAPEEQRAPR